MKTKSTRGAQTRQRILSSAASLMYKQGVNGTSVDDVLAASGTGKSQFYHYFSSKEALVRELVSYHLAALPAARDDLLARLDSLEGIKAWLDQILDDYAQGRYSEGCPFGNLASELAGQDEGLRHDLQAVFSHWETQLTNGLRKMLGQRQLRAGVDPEALGTYVVAAIEGALLLAKTRRSAEPLQATVRQIHEHLTGLALGGSRRPSWSRRLGHLTFAP